MNWRLSIDFGTTNTTAAYRDPNGHIHDVRLSTTSNLMPSAVFADDDDLLVGSTAVNLSRVNPLAFEPHPKRRLVDGAVVLGSRTIDAVDLAATVINHVRTAAQTAAGVTFTSVVLTHPDGWGTEMQRLLHAAGRRAGFDESQLQLISEAQAAATYYSTRTDLSPDPRICVFDFGAGTCDVAVLDRTDTGYRVAASDGLNHLGGNDLDGRLFDWAINEAQQADPRLARRLQVARERLTLIDRIRDAKESLSSATRAPIPIAGDTVLQIRRPEFERLIAYDIARCVEKTRDVISASRRINDMPVSRIYLVGGSSSIPLVHNQLAQLAPIETLGDPKLVVAHGALADDSPHTVELVSANNGEALPAGATVILPQLHNSGAAVDVCTDLQVGDPVQLNQPVASVTTRTDQYELRSPVQGTVRFVCDSPTSLHLGAPLYAVASSPVSFEQVGQLPTKEAVHAITTPEQPRRRRRTISIAVVAVLFVAAISAVGYKLSADTSGSESRESGTSSRAVSGFGSATFTTSTSTSTSCAIADNPAPGPLLCSLYSRIPESVTSAARCFETPAAELNRATQGVSCQLDYSKPPYYGVVVYYYGSGRAPFETATIFSVTDKQFPTPFSKQPFTDGSAVYSMPSYGAGLPNSLCATRPNSKIVTCTFYLEQSVTPAQAYAWWREQPGL